MKNIKNSLLLLFTILTVAIPIYCNEEERLQYNTSPSDVEKELTSFIEYLSDNYACLSSVMKFEDPCLRWYIKQEKTLEQYKNRYGAVSSRVHSLLARAEKTMRLLRNFFLEIEIQTENLICDLQEELDSRSFNDSSIFLVASS